MKFWLYSDKCAKFLLHLRIDIDENNKTCSSSWNLECTAIHKVPWNMWQCCITAPYFPREWSFLSWEKAVKLLRNQMTFGAVKHSVYESGTGAKCEQPRCARRDFVKIALPCRLKAIRSIFHVAHATFIRFHSTSRHPEIKDEVNFWIICQPGNRSSIYNSIGFANCISQILLSLKNCSSNRT